MSGRSAELSPAAQALLARRSAKARPEPTIPRLGPDAPPPLSFAQWRLWFLEQLRPGTNAWNTPVVARLQGRLEVEALRRALELVVTRQKTLRTVFPAPGGKPVPVVVEHPAVELPVVDIDDQALEGLVADEVRRSFDLTSDLMVRAKLARLAAEEHVLILVAHHIACDGWSKGLLLKELGTAYDALLEGSDPVLPELAIDYGDYAAWQRNWLSGENLERLSGYWTERLSEHAPFAELPTDLPRPRTQQFLGAIVPLTVTSDLAQAVVALGRRHRATPFMTLMAAFKALLYVHTGQEDLLVGSPSAMRGRPELEQIVGLFANTLVYRTDLSGRPTFSELLRRVQATALGVYQHQDLPFEKIVEAVRPRRDASRNPLVQVNMRVEGKEPEVRLHGIRSEPIAVDPGIARFDLAIELGATDDGYAGYLEYDTRLFEQPTATLLADRFIAVLEAAVGCPDVPIAELDAVRAIRAVSGLGGVEGA